MPNNPGRVNGDYSIGEIEEVRYVDPGNFGATRSESSPIRIRLYVIALGVLAVALVVMLALGRISL